MFAVIHTMIYADFLEEPDFHELVALLREKYRDVRYGQQGDSWIWVDNRGMKVEIDTFTSMHFQVKSPSEKRFLVVKVLELLQNRYKLNVYAEPELEAHE